MIFLLLQGVYFQLFVCKVIRLYNLPLQLTEQNKRTECLRKSITYRPCSRRGKSSLSQGRSSDSFPPLRLPSLKPVAKSARSCPIRAETHSNGYCRRFSRHSLIISGNRITSGKPCDAKLKNICFIALKYNGTYCQICGRKTFYSNEDLPVSAGVCLTCYVTSRSKAT